jgi:hypothetical protein
VILLLVLTGCDVLLDLFSTDTYIDVSCAGEDTVIIDGRDICEEYETTGRVKCTVGYRIKLDGKRVCPPQ